MMGRRLRADAAGAGVAADCSTATFWACSCCGCCRAAAAAGFCLGLRWRRAGLSCAAAPGNGAAARGRGAGALWVGVKGSATDTVMGATTLWYGVTGFVTFNTAPALCTHTTTEQEPNVKTKHRAEGRGEDETHSRQRNALHVARRELGQARLRLCLLCSEQRRHSRGGGVIRHLQTHHTTH